MALVMLVLALVVGEILEVDLVGTDMGTGMGTDMDMDTADTGMDTRAP